MNEIIAKLYDKAVVIEDGGDYVCGELDPMKFAELIIKECLAQVDAIRDECEADNEDQQALGADWVGLAIARYFGVSDER